MHPFDYKELPGTLLSADVVNMLTRIHECKGRQELFIEAEPDVLSSLLEIAKIQSTKASNRIEGIFTSDERLNALVKEKAAPHNRSEEEIAGYREALATIHESYEYIPVSPNSILQLHRDMYQFSSTAKGGSFKNTDNIIAESDTSGKQIVRFQPLPAFQTPEAMEELCSNFNAAMQDGKHDPLILIPMFVLDFLCIHPFSDGNGRMSRLLTLLLLYRAGFIVGKYISLEMLIEKTKTTYYESLKISSDGWHDNASSIEPFLRYYLGIILSAYRNFDERVGHLHRQKMSKPERIREVFDRKPGKIRKADIMEMCPDISLVTVNRTIAALLQEGYIMKVGHARATAYVKVQ